MKTYVIKIKEIVGKEEIVHTTTWEAENAEQVEKELFNSYNEKDWKKVLWFSIYSVNPIPEIMFYADKTTI